MDVIKIKLERYRIEWDGPIIFVKEDEVTVLSPFQILHKIENASSKVKQSIYSAMSRMTTREELLTFLEKLGDKILSIRL